MLSYENMKGQGKTSTESLESILSNPKEYLKQKGIDSSLLDDDSICNILSEPAVLETFHRYDEATAQEIVWRLGRIAADTKNKDTVIKLAKIMSLDDVVDTVKTEVYDIIFKLISIATYTGSEDAVVESARTIRRYKRGVAGDVAYYLKEIAYDMMDENAVIESARTIRRQRGWVASGVALWLCKIADCANKEVVVKSIRTIGRYEGEVAGSIAYVLSEIAARRNKDAVAEAAEIMSLDEIVDTVKRYEIDLSKSIVHRLGKIAEYTKDKEAVVESARTIGRHKEETAREIAYILEYIAVYNTRSDYSTVRNFVMRACGVINKIGNGILNVFDAHDMKEILDLGLDGLIDGKKSSDSVAAYIRAKGELPLPTKDNINEYGELISRRLSDEYGITKELEMNQLFMLCSVDKEERKGLAKLLNESYETNRKTYSINVKDEKEGSLNSIDRSRLPYLSVIAVIGSVDKSNEEKAMDAVSKLLGDKAVKRARNTFNSKYRNLKKEIIDHVRNGKLEDAIRLLKETGDESINDVMSVSDSRDLSDLKGNNLLNAVESNNPLDYDSRVQMACVYLPRDYNEGVKEYCRDKRFHLIRYDVNGTTLGSAICYLEDGKFLVDSVEGHRTFNKRGIFNAVYRDLIDRARDLGAEKIVFSTGGINRTPMAFIESLKKRGLELGSTSMKLDTEGYLEAEHMVNGYVIRLK